MADRPFDLTLDPAMGYHVADLIREYDTEDFAESSEDDAGDGLIADDDELLDRAAERQGDPLEQELADLIAGLSIDAQRDLLALVWVGRGDYTAGEWSAARRQARETTPLHVADYLEETPLASDYLVEGLTALGYPQADFEGR